MILLGTLYPLVLDAGRAAPSCPSARRTQRVVYPVDGPVEVVMASACWCAERHPVKWLAGMLMPVLLGSVALVVIVEIVPGAGDLTLGVLATLPARRLGVTVGVRVILSTRPGTAGLSGLAC